MRYRITIRGDGVELRGYVDGNVALGELAEAMRPYGLVVVSEAAADYDPFKEHSDGTR